MNGDTKKALGLWTLTALVAGNMIGSGIFMLPAALAKIGSIGLVSWILTAIGTLFMAGVFARLAKKFPKTGGPYVYCHEAYGEFIGFQIAYGYWIAVWVGNAAIAVTFVGYISTFFPEIQHSNHLALMVTIGVLWLITFINVLGAKEAGIVQVVTTVLKLVPLLVIASVGLFYINPENLGQFNISGMSTPAALTSAATLTMWSFIGFESATIPADNAIDPEKNIPRATIIGTLIATVVYISSTVALMGVIPPEQLAQSSSPFADGARVMFGYWGGGIIALAGAIACFGTLNGWILMQGQVPLAAARDGLFPQAFAKTSKNGTPVFGLVVSSILITGMLLLQYGANMVELFTQIILLATLAQLIPYVFTSLAELLLLVQRSDDFSFSKFWRATVLAIGAFVYGFWVIYGAGEKTIAYGMLLTLTGIPIYIWLKAKARELPELVSQAT